MINRADIPRSAYGDSMPPAQLLEEVADVRTVAVSPSVEIGYSLINRQLLGEEPAIISPGGFMSDITTPDRAYEAVQLASLGRPVMLVDMPGHGHSTPHSTKQIIDLQVRRDSTSQAAPVLEAVQRVLGETDQIDYFGNSHGGHLSLNMAALDPVDRVGTVFGIDIPAVRRRSTIGMQVGFVIIDGMIRRKEYLAALEGTDAQQDYEHFKEVYEAIGPERARSFVKQNPGLVFINLFSSGNASPLALKAWKSVMQNKSAHVAVVTSESGHVSSPEAIDTFIQSLLPEQQERSHQTVALGENHNLAMVHLMPRAVGWAAHAFARNLPSIV